MFDCMYNNANMTDNQVLKYPNNSKFMKMRNAMFKNSNYISHHSNPNMIKKLGFDKLVALENTNKQLNIRHFVIWD